MEIEIREYLPEDKNFVYSTFLRGLYYGNALYNKIDKPAFFENYTQVLSNMLLNPSNRLLVACEGDDPALVLGWLLASSQGALHFVYVKSAFRNHKIASELVNRCELSSLTRIKYVTHLTDASEPIRLKKNWPYNPFKME